MPAKKHSQLHQWGQTMIDAYHDYQWHLVLDPLYEKFQDWKAGDVSHPDTYKFRPRALAAKTVHSKY